MNILHLLHKLRVVPDVEIVIAFLPEMLRVRDQASGRLLALTISERRQGVPVRVRSATGERARA